MTNETTASQPKSIGDDAQFQKLATNWFIRNNKADHDAMIAYLDSKLRATAAQASATIQAAPELLKAAKDFYNATVADKQVTLSSLSQDKRDIAFQAAERLRTAILAATIQEPVMVAEPVGVAEPDGGLLPCPFCGGDVTVFGGHNNNPASVNCNDCDSYGPSVRGSEAAVIAWNRRAAAPLVPVQTHQKFCTMNCSSGNLSCADCVTTTAFPPKD